MKANENKGDDSRRTFIKKTAFACTAFPFLTKTVAAPTSDRTINPMKSSWKPSKETAKSIIGDYGHWAAGLVDDPPKLSFRKDSFTDVVTWKKEALQKTEALMACPEVTVSDLTVHKKYEYDGLDIEELSWKLSNSSYETKAILLKPQGAIGPLPGILGLHDHGGKKYFGVRKITKVSDEVHPMMQEHYNEYYSGFAWANEIAKRGYVVLVHDVFAFGSKRVRFGDIAGITWGHNYLTGQTDENPEKPENIEVYNDWASDHEYVMSKSLIAAGTNWSAIDLVEDQIALDILADRDEVDAERLGCGGLSGGGIRSLYLGGLDHRIKCALTIGFLTTWKDIVINKAFTHTWMVYTPLLSHYLDLPEILGLRVPLPTMVLNNSEDQLFTNSEMKRADSILRALFEKAGASEKYQGKFYDGPHKFDAKMQSDAFEWFDKWLKY